MTCLVRLWNGIFHWFSLVNYAKQDKPQRCSAKLANRRLVSILRELHVLDFLKRYFRVLILLFDGSDIPLIYVIGLVGYFKLCDKGIK